LVDADESGYLVLNCLGFGVVAIKARQEQQTELLELKN
jgi:hypothetical protein